jgi:hypothetical protein
MILRGRAHTGRPPVVEVGEKEMGGDTSDAPALSSR